MITLTTEQAQQIEEALRHATMLIDGQPACNHRICVCYCKEATALDIIQAARAQANARSTSEHSEQAEQEPVTMLDDPIFSVNPEYLEARKEAFLKAASNCDARRWIYLNRLNAMYFMPCENKTEPTDRIIFDCEGS